MLIDKKPFRTKKESLPSNISELPDILPSEIPLKKETKRKNGLTLLELSIVSMIIGGLSIYYLPRFLTCASLSRYSQGKIVLDKINQRQHKYYQKKNEFANSLQDLKFKLPESLKYHQISMVYTPTAVFAYALPKTTEKDSTGTLISGIFTVNNTQEKTASILCQSKYEDGKYIQEISPPFLLNNQPICGENSQITQLNDIEKRTKVK